MLAFVIWILGSIAASYISIKFMRTDEALEYRSSSDIKEEFLLLLFLSVVGTWVFAYVIGTIYIIKKYEKNIVDFIKGEKNEK